MVLTIFSFHFSLNSELKTKDFGVLIPERGGMGFQNTDAMDSEIGAGTSKKIRPTFGNLFPSKMSFFRLELGVFSEKTMSRRASSPKLELTLNLSPPRAPTQQVGSPNTSVSSREMSPESSCVSSEPDDSAVMVQSPSSPEATSMVLVGCPRCLMYVMLSEVDPKCPRCKSTVLLDFLNEENTKKTRN
ncbi:hypothetical protein GQ457_12G027260 [Hibiscus cannabinus]